MSFCPFIETANIDMENLSRTAVRETVYEVHIADLHFGAIDPETEYNILRNQFLSRISSMRKLDIVSVNGDIFDRKFMSNSDAVYYAIKFIDELVGICRAHNATLVLISGTPSHDSNQLKLFYHYQHDKTVDVRVVTLPQMQWIKGIKVLCIPEMHGYPEEDYQKYLYNDWCDQIFGHMTVKGAVYGDNVGTGRLFDIEDFLRSRGPIFSGHIHVPGNFIHDFYYTGSPIRYKFGEEQTKGFMVCVFDPNSRQYYTELIPIDSFTYTTIDMVDIINDPKGVIEYINDIKEKRKIDHIKVRFQYIVDGANKVVITNYYHNRSDVKLEFKDNQQQALEKLEEEQKEQGELYSFLSDSSITDEEKFCRYVNIQEGHEFITVDKLKEILEDGL